MGTDELAVATKTSAAFEASTLITLVTDHWVRRGARQIGSTWIRKAQWKDDTQDVFAVALHSPTPRGWVTLVESVDHSTSVDAEILRALAARAPTWVSWNFDHSAIYGQKRISKSGAKEPVDLCGLSYDALGDVKDWTFLVFAGVRPTAWKRFVPSARTKSDALPRDPEEELRSAIRTAIMALDVDGVVKLLKRLGGACITDSEIDLVFNTKYPIEWPENADSVARTGAAVAAMRPLPAWAWVRLLEVAAVQNDAALRARAEAGLAASNPKQRSVAINEASARFAARAAKVGAARRMASLAKSAAIRFEAWTGGEPKQRRSQRR